MTDHDVQVHAAPNGLVAGFDTYAVVLICTCGAILGDFDMARPGELWKLEQDHRIAMAVAGPDPAVRWPTVYGHPWPSWLPAPETPTAPPATGPSPLG